MWNTLYENGILDKELLQHLWKDEIDRNAGIIDVFIEVMKVFSLLFEMKDKQGNQILLVPCQMKVATDSLKVNKDDKQTASVYVTPTDFLPDSVYSVLVVGFLNFMEKKFKSVTKSNHVKLFQNRSDFDLYDDHRVSLGTVKIERRHALKLEISRLPAFDEYGTKVIHAPRPSVCLEVINYLKEQLEIVYGTTEGIGYNLHVCCHMCPSKPTTLSSFHKLDECLSKDIIRCDDKVVTTAHFKRLYPGKIPDKQNDEENLVGVKTRKTGKARELSQNPIKRLTEKEIVPVPERTKPEEQGLRSLLTELSKQYPCSNCRWLRCLLFDLLPIEDLSNAGDNAMALFNKLETEGHISCSNVIILSEVAQLTKIKSVISYITEYNRANHCDEEGTVLTIYRKSLFCAMRQVAPDELPGLIHHYQLDSYQNKFMDVWDVVYYLERDKLLDDTPDKVKRFAGLLNGRARDVLLDALTSPTTKKATEGVTNVTKGVTTNEVSDSLDVTEGVTKKEVTDSSTGVTGGVASKDVTAKTEVTCKMTPEKQSGTKRRKRNRNRNRNGQTENTPKEEEITTVCPNKYLMIFLAFCLLAIVLLAIVGLVQ